MLKMNFDNADHSNGGCGALATKPNRENQFEGVDGSLLLHYYANGKGAAAKVELDGDKNKSEDRAEEDGIIVDGSRAMPLRTYWSSRSVCYKINTILLFLTGILLITIGILLIIFPLFNVLTTLRLRMTPGLPPFEFWAHPKPDVFCRAYIFTVTNPDEFLSGADKKMKIKEIGPIVYKEHLEHRDVVFHENSTMSYTVHRYLEFLPEMNEEGILNRTMIVPNIVLLGMASRIADSMFTVKIPFNMLSKTDPIFVNTTIYNYFWNFTTPALVTVEKYLPFLVPMDNGGTLHTVYKDFTDRVNVRIGPDYSFDEFFMINTVNYRPTVPRYMPENGECFASLVNSSEGAIYQNFLQNDSVPIYWRKAVCRPVPLYFQKEMEIEGITGYKFVTRVDWYDRLGNLTEDCYKGFGKTVYPNGLSDASKCYSDLPIAVSAPHFYGRDGFWNDQLEGFTPNLENHTSYAIIEPITGVPLDQKARSQSNMVMPKLSGFSAQISRFSNMVVPIIWVEYHLPKLTPEINSLLFATANVLPRLTYILPVIFFVLSVVCLFLALRRISFNGILNFKKYSLIHLNWEKRNVYKVSN